MCPFSFQGARWGSECAVCAQRARLGSARPFGPWSVGRGARRLLRKARFLTLSLFASLPPLSPRGSLAGGGHRSRVPAQLSRFYLFFGLEHSGLFGHLGRASPQQSSERSERNWGSMRASVPDTEPSHGTGVPRGTAGMGGVWQVDALTTPVSC